MKQYIDFEIARKYLHKACESLGGNGGMMLKIKFDQEPRADVVEAVHGKWIPRTNLPKQEIFICSVCGGWAYSPWIGSRKKPKPNWCKYKYCPNCGADMEVEE